VWGAWHRREGAWNPVMLCPESLKLIKGSLMFVPNN
jgi:hypothetical protein